MTWVDIQVQCQEEDLEPFVVEWLSKKTEALKVHKAVCGNTVNGQMQLLSGFFLALYKVIAQAFSPLHIWKYLVMAMAYGKSA